MEYHLETAPWDEHDEYHISRVVLYARFDHSTEPDSLESWLTGLESIESVAEEEEDEAYVKAYHLRQKISWLEVPLGMTILQLVQMPHHIVIGGIVHLMVLVRDNQAHAQFIKGIKDRGETLRYIDDEGRLVSLI